jgi:hypothetical protein
MNVPARAKRPLGHSIGEQGRQDREREEADDDPEAPRLKGHRLNVLRRRLSPHRASDRKEGKHLGNGVGLKKKGEQCN